MTIWKGSPVSLGSLSVFLLGLILSASNNQSQLAQKVQVYHLQHSLLDEDLFFSSFCICSPGTFISAVHTLGVTTASISILCCLSQTFSKLSFTMLQLTVVGAEELNVCRVSIPCLVIGSCRAFTTFSCTKLPLLPPSSKQRTIFLLVGPTTHALAVCSSTVF